MKKKLTGVFTESELALYVNQLLTRGPYKRYLDRFFMGVVTTVKAITNSTGLVTGYTCQIQRTGEATADGNTYYVLGQYVPVIGDIVECIWRDKTSGYVLGSLIRQNVAPVRSSQTGLTALALTAGVWTNVGSAVSITTRVASRIRATATLTGSHSTSTTDYLRFLFNGNTGDSGGTGQATRDDAAGNRAVLGIDTYVQPVGTLVTAIQTQIDVDNTGTFTPRNSQLQIIVEALPLT